MLNKEDIPLNLNIADLNRFSPEKGRLLIASPFMTDPSFKRAVILLTEYNEKGAFGLILNKCLNLQITETLQGFPDFDAQVYTGGPVENERLFYVHTLGTHLPESKKIFDDLYWGGDFEQLKSLIKTGLVPTAEIRFFIGYAGWGSEQLRCELAEGSWIVSDCDTADVMSSSNNLSWKKLLKKMGDMFAVMADFPENPFLN